MTKEILNLTRSAACVVFIVYGCVYIMTELCVSCIPLGMLLIILMVFGIHCLRIPPPNQEAVEAIVGKDLLQAENANSNSICIMKTIAHRGAGLDAPENTLEAFKMCSEKGCDAIEFDVTLTSDGVPIVFHDKTLERMADSNLVVNDTEWEVLSQIDISVKHPFRERFTNTNINIPKLEDAVLQLLAAGQRMFIDIKDYNTKIVPVILRLYEEHPELISRAVVTSFFPNIIYLIRRGNPRIVCSLAYRPHSFAYESYQYPEGRGPRRSKVWYIHYFLILCDILHDWAISRITYYWLGLSIILLHKDVLSAQAVLEWKKKGLRVMVWTVNSPIEKQHLARNLKITYLTDTLTGESTAHIPPS